ncbi:MAG: AAA family ATPase [Lachnospiraceae bacterium]|nr:AAA family ATPase [Lachnospiraceae bacterium]
MRYFGFVLKTNSEQIKENAKIRLKEYDYQSPVAAMNNYMYKNMKNGICYFAYREDGGATLAAFSYDEKKGSFRDAYDYIIEMLNDVFSIKQVKAEPCEITMYQFYECLLEAKRREYFLSWTRILEAANIRVYDYFKNEQITFHYSLKEKIISENHKKENQMYDKSVINELSNIESHKNTSDFKGNMVHYIISSRSAESANDITETLMQKLAESNRLSGRRMEIISEIEPDLYNVNNHLEEFIENNYGGVIVIDLSEKFGYDSVDYEMTCKYIEKLVKKYRNDCLFVFTYNIEKPGFAYQFLPLVRKHVISVMLKEGKGDRKAAVNYMKELIKASEYSKYARLANEFMKLFPGNIFSQTDVLMAFEQFEPWCLNRNVLQAYDYNYSDTFMLDRDENNNSSYDKLNKMIGLTSVKEQINHIIAADIVEKERKKRQGNAYELGTMHMIFGGNPGSAKTTVAKLFAGIAREKGILKSGAFVECGGMDLDGLGCTIKIRKAFMEANGGVLFIDEAYSLNSDTAVTILIQEMENRRDDVIVILAGYNERMRAFMEINEGLKSRIPYWIDFPDYNVDELTDIFKMMVKERGFAVTVDAIREARNIFERVRFMDNFGNGRYVRNLIECAVQNQSIRLLAARENAENIRKKELFLIAGEDISILQEGLKNDRKIGAARKELNEMIGLASVKAIISKIIASFKLKKVCMDKGICNERPSLHMVFTGNPGTAKTTVARLFTEIMKDEKVLSSGNFVEVGRADLVSDHVGATAPLVKKKFREAQGGVLFIDEAYSLCDSYENGFGDEAINTLVQEMENHRDDVIVIFAGYSDQMKAFLDRNPGMSSRIAFHVDFEDYSTNELCDITRLMLSRKQMKITDAAMEKLKKIYESGRGSRGFGNGRFVRKMLEEAEMNLAERVSQLDESTITTELITTIEERDIPESDVEKHPKKKQIGFCVA